VNLTPQRPDRVQGARVNNLQGPSAASVPKRRVTRVHRISGRARARLVFGTSRRVAADAQRDLQRLRGRASCRRWRGHEVRRPRGVTTAIIGDQEQDRVPTPLHGRHRHDAKDDDDGSCQSARDAVHRLASGRFSSTSASISGAGAVTLEAGREDREGAEQISKPAAGSALRGGARSHFDCRPSTTTAALNEGALTIPGLQPGGWYAIFKGCGLLDPDKQIGKFTRRSSTTCSTRSRPEESRRRHATHL